MLVSVSVLVIVFSRRSRAESDADRLKSNSIRAFLELEASRRSCVDKPLEVFPLFMYTSLFAILKDKR